MASGHSIGTIFVELDLDPTRYMRGQKQLLREAKSASDTLEKNFHNLGIKSDATFDLMRNRARLSYQAIKNDSRTTFSDMLRAHKAYQVEMQRLTHEQFMQEKNLNQQRKQMSRDSQAGWLSMMKGMLAYRVILSAITVVQEAFFGTFKYLERIETGMLGIAASISMSGQFIDKTTGKALEGADALRAAQVMSKQLMEELKAANLETVATLDQLIVAFQQTLPVAMARGFNIKQVKDFTLAMVQAAGAIGLPMEQLAEETRALLTGAINPRTSRIATVLGLRNEDIAVYKKDAQGLFDFLMDKLAAYRIAGVEAQYTWAGLWSNMKDIAFAYLGEGMKPLFEGIKTSMIEITKGMVKLNESTGKLEWNPEFLESIKTLKSAFTTIVADCRRIAMLIDLIGIGLALAGQVATFGLSKTMKEWEKRLTERLKNNEKLLMDMAMKEEGWTPAKEGVFYSGKETKTPKDFYYYDKEITYIREITDAVEYRANKSKLSADDMKKADEERINLLKLEAELTEKQMRAREEWAEKQLSATEAATKALNKFVEKELEGEAKALADVGMEMESVNAKLREMYNITADTIDINPEYLRQFEELTAAGERRIEQIKEHYIQQNIIHNKVLKDLQDEQRASLEAETGTDRGRMTPDELSNLRQGREEMERSLESALHWDNAYRAIQLLNDGLAEHRQRAMEARDAVYIWEDAWNYASTTTQGYMNQIADATLSAFRSMEDAITAFVMTGKNSFRDFANAVIADLVRIAVRASVTAPLMKIAGGMWGALGGNPDQAWFGSMTSDFSYKAAGGPVSAGSSYIVGERGPELFVPSSSGTIVPGGGKGSVTVNIKNESGQPVAAKTSTATFDAQGWVIDVVLDGLNRNVRGLRTAMGGA